MHHALVLSVFSSTFLILTTLSGTTGDPGPSSLSEDGSFAQTQAQPKSALIPDEIDEEKRSWRDLQNGWGKRAWKDRHMDAWEKRAWKDLQSTGWGKRSWEDLRNGWGKRDLQNSWDKRAWSDLKGGSWGKRGWNQFRGGWGKRDRHPFDDQLENLYDYSENFDDEEDAFDEDLTEDEKRAWSNLKGQWGKRDWSSFKGSWGKRDPAWHNLKGLWGKRSVDSKWAKLQGGWGKRSIGGTVLHQINNPPHQRQPRPIAKLTHEGERMSTEIPIWMNGKIRWLSGIDKKTTCKDVVEVLLEEAGVSKSEAKDFTIMERWRKVERQLDENSKILKIWSHWGSEKKEVRLCLRRIDNEVDSGRGSPVGSGYLPSLRRKRNRIRGHGKHPWAYRETLHPRRLAELGRFDKKDYDDYPHVKTKQSELINDYEALDNTNAYDNKIYYDRDSNDRIRDAENVNGKLSEHRSYHCSGTGRLHSTPVGVSTENHSKRPNCCSKRESKQRIRNSENIEKLMKLILAQGATIQSQLQKLKEREEQIELLEHERHRERVEKNGRNYLLETYLGSLKDAEIPEEPKDEDNQTERTRCEEETNFYGTGKIYGKSHAKAHSRHGREDQDFSSKPQHKGARSKSESRTQKCKAEGNLKRTFSDNALAEASAAIKENECGREEEVTQELSRQDTKEESEEVVELRKIQSQIEMWEKVFKINKKLEKEEENLVRLHIKIKKVQSENYKIVKEKMEGTEKEKDAEVHFPGEKSNPEIEDPERMQYEHDCSELEKNLETLKSDLEHNSKEIYKNFTKLLEEDEIVEQKRSCLSKIMTDLERTNHEHEMLNEMIAMSGSQNCQNEEMKSFCEGPIGCGSVGKGLPVQHTEPEASSEKLCSSAVSLPERAQESVNQRAETNEDEVSLPMKPKIVKISFEDKIQNYESSEGLQYKVPYKEPTPVPTGALKSILKNRKNSFNKICNLSNEYQKYQGFSQSNEPDKLLQKNFNMSDCYTDNYYVHPCNVPDQINSSYAYPIPYPLYVNYPNERKQPQEITRTPFSHGAMITTKAVVHNDTDSSTSSDTSGLSSMYSSSTNAEEPYAEKSYVLDTLV